MDKHLLTFFYTSFCIVELAYHFPLQAFSLTHKYLADSLQDVVALVDDEENFVKIDVESDASHKVLEEPEKVHICRLTDGGAARRDVEDGKGATRRDSVLNCCMVPERSPSI